MKKIKLTKVGKIAICGFSFAVVGSLLAFNTNSSTSNMSLPYDYEYVGKIVINKETAVVQSTSIILKPYLDENVKLVKNYYNYKGTEEEQINSIIYYESTYMPNYAAAYGGVDNFEVISVLDGVVSSVKKDDLLGNIIEIKHSNDLISVYQSVNDITVSENQTVKQGDVIAKSGTSNINKDLNSHLLFELIYKGEIVNPEEYYNKDINQL